MMSGGEGRGRRWSSSGGRRGWGWLSSIAHALMDDLIIRPWWRSALVMLVGLKAKKNKKLDCSISLHLSPPCAERWGTNSLTLLTRVHSYRSLKPEWEGYWSKMPTRFCIPSHNNASFNWPSPPPTTPRPSPHPPTHFLFVSFPAMGARKPGILQDTRWVYDFKIAKEWKISLRKFAIGSAGKQCCEQRWERLKNNIEIITNSARHGLVSWGGKKRKVEKRCWTGWQEEEREKSQENEDGVNVSGRSAFPRQQLHKV